VNVQRAPVSRLKKHLAPVVQQLQLSENSLNMANVMIFCSQHNPGFPL